MRTSDFSGNTYIIAWQFILIAKAVEAMQPKAIFELVSGLADLPAHIVLCTPSPYYIWIFS